MSHRNWAKAAERDRARLQGTQHWRSDPIITAPLLGRRWPRRRRKTKEELRDEFEELLAAADVPITKLPPTRRQ